jgi:hypothetical protein
MVPAVQDMMEGCPEDADLTLLYLVLSAFVGLFVCFMFEIIDYFQTNKEKCCRSQETRSHDGR